MAHDTEEQPDYIHRCQNEFSYCKHKKQKDEDIAICECKHDINQPNSACAESCLNVLTSTECAPGFCPCGFYCKNQRFQKCEYVKTKLFKTENRGWGLLANEDIKDSLLLNTVEKSYHGKKQREDLKLMKFKVASKLRIKSMCTSSKLRIKSMCTSSFVETKLYVSVRRAASVRDAFIISLNASESIDATKKGSLAWFINHPCQPIYETRKWNFLGEIRVGIFAKQDMAIGTELAYNYEWYGGAKEDTYVWEDDNDRYSVEKIPLYDSAEDEPSSKLFNTMIINSSNSEYTVGGMITNVKVDSDNQFLSTSFVVQSLDSVPMDIVAVNETKAEANEERKLCSQDTEQAFAHKIAMMSHTQSCNVSQKYQIGSRSVPKKRSKKFPNGRMKNLAQKQVDAKAAALLLPSKEAQEEGLKYEEMKNAATSEPQSLYNEIRPAIEEHERDNQDGVATSVAEKWIEASCMKFKAEFDLYFSIVKNVVNIPSRACGQAKPFEGDNRTEINYLTN